MLFGPEWQKKFKFTPLSVLPCATMFSDTNCAQPMPSPLDYFCLQSNDASLFTSHPCEASELFATMACDGALKL